MNKEKRKVKSRNQVFLCFQKPKQLHKDRGEDGEEENISPLLSVCSSLYQCFYGDTERGWDRWRCCHGDRQGVRACVCMHVNVFLCVCVCSRYPARPGSAPCALPPEAFDTSLAALFLSPMAQRERVRERV